MTKVHNNRFQTSGGSSMVLLLMIIIVVTGVIAVVFLISSSHIRAVKVQQLSIKAFNNAEAGVERALLDLREDVDNAVDAPDWSDGDINGMSLTADTDYYSVGYAGTDLNDGTYLVEFKNVADTGEYMWIRSTGTAGGVTHQLEVLVRMIDYSIWDNAIFGGAGLSGKSINGNTEVHGSVTLLATSLSAGDYAMDLSGTAAIVLNNYDGLDASTEALIAAMPTKIYNGETVETLNAVLRVRKGIVGVSGNAVVGEPNASGDSNQETMDGSYVTDGYGGTQGSTQVYSENGVVDNFDLGDAIEFPYTTDSYDVYTSYEDYLRANAYILTSAEEALVSAITPNSSFSFGDAKGTMSMDGSGNMSINGIIFVDNSADVNMNKVGGDSVINYSGSGSLYVTGDVEISTSLMTTGSQSYPESSIMGVMTPNTINMDLPGATIMAILYAESAIYLYKNMTIIGSLVSDYVDMGTNVPSIFHVPAIVDNLPPGMIGSESIIGIDIVSWSQTQ